MPDQRQNRTSRSIWSAVFLLSPACFDDLNSSAASGFSSQLFLCIRPEGQQVSEEHEFSVWGWRYPRYPVISRPTQFCGLRLAGALATQHDKGQAISSSSNRDGFFQVVSLPRRSERVE